NYSPTSTLSPYRRPSRPPARTPSPGTRSRERTPSPGSRNAAGPPQGGINGFGAGAAAGPRSTLTLRERPGAAPPVSGNAKPVSSRYGGAGGSRPGSASRAGSSGLHQPALHVPYEAEVRGAVPPHQPGSLFGLAANLGIGPAAGGAAVAASFGSSSEDAEACDIDARLQALQSFLKQTKNISG
ncbi:unnamed protein product, partial [Polarella glacialis]